MFNATLNSISVLLMEENSENHQPVTHHWQTLLHNIVSSTHHHKWEFELTTFVVLGTDCRVSHGKMYSIKHYVIKFVSDLQQVGGFLQVLRFLQQ
jgi:hypothetical protein